jgi:hypothetical protein
MLYINSSPSALRHFARPTSPRLPPADEPMSAQMLEIRAAAAAAWRAYAATGMSGDDLRPVQGGTADSLRVRASLFDSLGTLFVMGLHDEYEQALAEVLRIGAPRTFIYQTSSFEYNIRVVGGLLSAAQLSGDKRLFAAAEEAANILLSSSYIFWPSPLPMPRVRMQPLTLLNFPVWLVARTMDVAWCAPPPPNSALPFGSKRCTLSGTCSSASSSAHNPAKLPKWAHIRWSCAR